MRPGGRPGRLGRAIALAALLVGAGLIAVPPAGAQAPPPMALYGPAASAESVIGVLVNGVECSQAEVTPLGGAYLWQVTIEAGECGAASGAVITFTVDGAAANESVTWTEGGLPDDAVAGIVLTVPGASGAGTGSDDPAPTPVPEGADFARAEARDLDDLDPENAAPRGLWSDGEILRVVEAGGGLVYAYELASGGRLEESDLALDGANREPWGIAAHGATAWVADPGLGLLVAYDLGSGERFPGRDIVLDRRNAGARGLWSDGETAWVADAPRGALFAYDLASGALLGEYGLAGLNRDPRGLWSDGVAIWVSDHREKRLFAYDLPAPGSGGGDLTRRPREDFSALRRARNNAPRGIWSDGGLMYVSDERDGRVYSYHMPAESDARLASLSLSGIDIGGFSSTRSEYAGAAPAEVEETTVEARAVRGGASVEIAPADADAGSPGHQASVADGDEITVTVTSADASRIRVYLVRIEQSACLGGGVDAGFSLLTYRGGSVGKLDACARERHITALYATDGGAFVPYILGAPAAVNRAFSDLHAGGLPSGTPLLARSDGPASPASPGERDEPPWPECLRGEVSPGLSLLLYEHGSLEALEPCARERGVTALYATGGGAFVPYIVGAPAAVNRGFSELYPAGLPPGTPLLARSAGAAPGGTERR